MHSLDHRSSRAVLCLLIAVSALISVLVVTTEPSLDDPFIGLRYAHNLVEGHGLVFNPGERVEEKPLLRVAVIDPLRVELMVPTALYGQVRQGDQLRIQPELPGSAAVMATVRHVDRVFDAASNSFRVRLSLPNPNYRLPAGLRCRTELNNVAAANNKAPTAVNAAVTAPAAHRNTPAAR